MQIFQCIFGHQNHLIMKKAALTAIILIVLGSCVKEHPKDYLTFQGKIENCKDSTLTIRGMGVNKTIKVNNDGTFKDTLKVSRANIYNLNTNSGKRAFVFLNNGYNLSLKGNYNDFINSFKFSGFGSETNNLAIAQYKYSKKIGNPMDLFALEKEVFNTKIKTTKKEMDSILNVYKNADSTFLNRSKTQNIRMFEFLEKSYDKQHIAAKERAVLLEKIAKGKPSPMFSNFENFKEGKTSLADFKGKYVYIDLWATWCKPCLSEIPFLKKTEKEYNKKNIEFVSISIDNERTAKTWENAHKKWRKMVTDKNLTGIQLFAGKDVDFLTAYQVNSIPRFILIDPQGNIIDSNAPRPSSPKLKELLTELGI